MQRQFRRFTWFILATIIVSSLAVGAVMAHEGRPVGDYRFIIGWLDEPAYEGFQNAVSVRVNKIVDAESAEAMGQQQEDHGEPGHHDEEPESTPEEHGEPGHHDEEPESTPEEHGEPGHHDEEPESTPEAHGEPGHHDAAIEAASAMSVAVQTSADSVSGLNVRIATEGFTFAPENVNGAHNDGEGHAHIYVDGEKITRVYTPWHYLGDIEPGKHEIRVALNANGHEEYTYGGSKVEAVTTVNVPEPHGHHHGAESVEAQSRMSVSISLEADPLGGANLFVTGTTGFTFAPQHVGDHHVPGEGHGHVYVDGVKVSRVYGEAMQLGDLEPGTHEIKVTLNNNEHSAYTWNGEVVQATATIHIMEGMGGDGRNGHGGHSSLFPMPSGAAKPLASIAGQDEGVAVPVEGLEGSLQVEVTHVATGVSRVMDLHAAWGDPGHYVAGLIPTASGVYEFRIFGVIEGTDVNESFLSEGGGGDFDDVQTSAVLQFPEQLPELREVVGAAQGARDIAQQAQDAALAAEAGAGTGDGGGNTLAVVALIIGIVGAILGAGGIYLAVQARRSS